VAEKARRGPWVVSGPAPPTAAVRMWAGMSMVLESYVEFLALPSSVTALGFGLGTAAEVLPWLKYRGRKGAGVRAFLDFAGASSIPLISALCRQDPFLWWPRACAVPGFWGRASRGGGAGHPAALA